MGARDQRVSLAGTQASLPLRLLFLHGGRDDERVAQLAERLARIGTPHTLAFDEGAPLERDLGRAMALVEGEPCVLMGHGYGAALALEVARRASAHRVVLVEPLVIPRAQGESSFEVERARSLAARTIELSAMGELAQAATRYAELLDLPSHHVVDVPAVAAQLENLARLHTPDSLDTPVVIVRGQRSPWLTRHAAGQLARALPGSRLFEVAMAGHDLPFTHSGELSFILRRAVLASLELV